MTIGGSIFLIAIGAILAFAVELQEQVLVGVTIQWDVIGFILMLAGILGLILAFTWLRPNRETVIEEERPVVERDRTLR